MNFDIDGRCCAIFIGWCYALADATAIYVVADGKPQRQMSLPLFYPNGTCYCHSFYVACGKSPYQVQNNKEFLQHLEGIQLGPDEIIMSYDVKAPFMSVPIQPALIIIEKLLEEDPEL